VQDQQIDLVDAELACALVEGVQRLVVAVVGDPDLPVASAASTAATVSSGGVWKTPKPRVGTSTPLMSFSRGTVALSEVMAGPPP
jgi:hypothetical protein